MEALIVALLALTAIVVLEAFYWIAISLARRTPVILISVLVGWLAARYGADHLESFGSARSPASPRATCWRYAGLAADERSFLTLRDAGPPHRGSRRRLP